MESNKYKYVYTCYDPLVWPKVVKIFAGDGKSFFSADPGAVKNILSPHKKGDKEFILWRIKIAHEKLHLLGKIILVNHSNCGAYRLSGITFNDAKVEEEFHCKELKKAAAVVKNMLPKVKVEIHYFLKNKQQIVW